MLTEISAAIEHRLTLERNLRESTVTEPWRRTLIGESRPMQKVIEIIRLVAARRSTVLITGETGTGKELAARAIHLASRRAHLPMQAVNCSAIPEALMESELFGHVRGAFTGAAQSRAGRFEQANGGTIFLDEIGELPLELQAKLLRVLQEREVQRLGSSETLRLDIRVIAATNSDLEQAIAQGRFRQDLFYRLNVVVVQMPALRERGEDIPLLANHFVEKICTAEDLPAKRIAPDALDRLMRYSWPGNVRQLEHAIEQAAVLSGDRRILSAADFRLPVSAGQEPDQPSFRLTDGGLDFDTTISRIERAILEQALFKAGGNKARAADLLRMKRTTFLTKLKALHIGCEPAAPVGDTEQFDVIATRKTA